MALARPRPVDRRWAENVPGNKGLVLRIGIDRPKNSADWMVQFWIKDDGQNAKDGHYILISPDKLRDGIHDGRFEGVGDQGKPCFLIISNSGTAETTVKKLYNTDYERPEQSVTVHSDELRRVLTEVYRRLEEK